MPGDTNRGLTRRLARAWMAAARNGLASRKAMALTCADFRLNLPRSLAPLVEGAGLGLTAERLAQIDRSISGLIDVERCEVRKVDYDIFGDDRGGLQATVRIAFRSGAAADVVCAATFARAGEKLSEVWIHADTVELRNARPAAV
jgi:hypothetical protein